MERADIRLKKDCEFIEILIMYHTPYHHKSSKKIDRLRKKRYDNLVKRHSEAVQQGLFQRNTFCYERSFNPIKPELDKIKKDLKALRKENLTQFKNLQVGDVVKIPFGFDSSGKSVETHYAICRDCTENDYEYVVQGKIVNKYRKDLTLEVRLLKILPHDSIEYRGKILKVADTFKYQMKYFNVIID